MCAIEDFDFRVGLHLRHARTREIPIDFLKLDGVGPVLQDPRSIRWPVESC